MRASFDARRILSLTLAGIVGVLGLYAWPWPTQDPILGLIDERRPDIYTGFRYACSTLWVRTPLIAWNVVFSVLSILSPAGTAP